MSSGLTRWTNNAQTTLNGAINASVTSIVVTSALGFPNPGPFRILIDNELMQVIGGYGTTTWTVATRGSIEGTAATTHSNTAAIIHDVTAFEYNAFRQDWNPISYNGVGDGAADDFTPIQNAVNDAHAQVNGGLVYLGSRSWKLNSNLTTYSNVAFISEGAVLSGTGAGSVTPVILWTGTGALTLPASLTVQSGGAAITGAISSTSTVTGTALVPTGLTGATGASRYVGATSSGAPVSGTFAVGDFVITRDGFIYVCTAAGTPGTWQQPAPSLSYGANIKALGTLSGGADAAIARDDHIHPTTNVALLNAANAFTANNTFSGGITGTVQTTAQGNITSVGTLTSLNVSGDIIADSGAANTGSLTDSVRFGGIGSGEGIASKRSSGGNQYGLDFYTNGLQRMHVTNSGDVWMDSSRLLFAGTNAKIIPSSSNLSHRNNADSADNLLIDDSGSLTGRTWMTLGGTAPFTPSTGDLIVNRGGGSPGSGVVYFGSSTGSHYLYYDGSKFNLTDLLSVNAGLTISGALAGATTGAFSSDVSMGGKVTLTLASSKIIPGSTQLSLRNNADSADNLLIVDAGDMTGRTRFTMPGPLVLTTAASKVVPGATSLTFRNNADNADNLKIDDGGAAHFRNTVDGISTITATTFSGALSGNATTATTLQTARNINTVSFNGSGDITVTAAAGTLTGGTLASGVTASSLTSVGTLGSLTMGGTLSKGANALTGSRNSSDVYPFVQGTVATGVQIWIQSSDPAGSANNGDIWIQG